MLLWTRAVRCLKCGNNLKRQRSMRSHASLEEARPAMTSYLLGCSQSRRTPALRSPSGSGLLGTSLRPRPQAPVGGGSGASSELRVSVRKGSAGKGFQDSGASQASVSRGPRAGPPGFDSPSGLGAGSQPQLCAPNGFQDCAASQASVCRGRLPCPLGLHGLLLRALQATVPSTVGVSSV